LTSERYGRIIDSVIFTSLRKKIIKLKVKEKIKEEK